MYLYFLGETNLWWSSIVLTQAQYLTPCYLGYSQTSLKHPMREKLATVTAHGDHLFSHGIVYHNMILYSITITSAGYRAEYGLSKYTPYLILMGELWSVFSEHFGEKNDLLTRGLISMKIVRLISNQ